MKGSKDKLSCTRVPLSEAERQVFDVMSQTVSAAVLTGGCVTAVFLYSSFFKDHRLC